MEGKVGASVQFLMPLLISLSYSSSFTLRDLFQFPVVYWTFTSVEQKSQLVDQVLHFHIYLDACSVA